MSVSDNDKNLLKEKLKNFNYDELGLDLDNLICCNFNNHGLNKEFSVFDFNDNVRLILCNENKLAWYKDNNLHKTNDLPATIDLEFNYKAWYVNGEFVKDKLQGLNE